MQVPHPEARRGDREHGRGDRGTLLERLPKDHPEQDAVRKIRQLLNCSCSNTFQSKSSMMYKGSGDKYAYCCNKNLCTEDPNPPKDRNLEVEFVALNGIAGGNNKLNNNVKYDVKYTSGLEERYDNDIVYNYFL